MRHRYYEGSDSRRPHPSDGSLRLLRFAFPRANAGTSPGPPFRPQPRDPSDGRFISRLSAIGHSRLRPYPAGSPRVHAETGSCSYRLAVRLQLLPTPLLGDAVTFGYKVTTHSDRDFHPADKASSRTHWMAGTSPAMTAEIDADPSYPHHPQPQRRALALVRVGDGDGERVGCIGGFRLGLGQQDFEHHQNLVLVGMSSADHGLLDLIGRVFGDRNPEHRR